MEEMISDVPADIDMSEGSHHLQPTGTNGQTGRIFRAIPFSRSNSFNLSKILRRLSRIRRLPCGNQRYVKKRSDLCYGGTEYYWGLL